MPKDFAFHTEFTSIAKRYAHKVYDVTKHFPKEELFGLVSQFRRAAVSISLNYAEGYARKQEGAFSNFIKISYGSLKECQWLEDFCLERKLISKEEFDELRSISDRSGGMLWGILKRITNNE